MGDAEAQRLWQAAQKLGKRSYPMSKVRGSGGEELLHIQGKGQWLHFAGAALKR